MQGDRPKNLPDQEARIFYANDKQSQSSPAIHPQPRRLAEVFAVRRNHSAFRVHHGHGCGENGRGAALKLKCKSWVFVAPALLHPVRRTHPRLRTIQTSCRKPALAQREKSEIPFPERRRHSTLFPTPFTRWSPTKSVATHHRRGG